ncbi:MAG: phosphoribosyl-ATP diphosphatase [Gammaproteobacteria bacterium]
MPDVLTDLANILEDRKHADPSTSYVASLYTGGTDAVLKKIGEEATELVMAGKIEDKKAVIHEAADLWFHSLVLLAQLGLGPNDILSELERRFGRPGLEEKAGREQ